MGDELNPHHLVALMSITDKERQDGASPYTDPSTQELKFGIKEDLEMNALTVSVLDALATLCISAQTSQGCAASGRKSPPIPTEFIKKLLQLRHDNPEGIEKSICEAVIALGEALMILRGLHKDPRQRCIVEESENVFWDSLWAKEKVKNVLADRDGFLCEN
ncbi:hypothetical protein HOY82DRAFT_596349 [Tuber indicum]|nr:hypothetical protein HOY82DRAFT_596349 [Tuber indicum]